MGWEHLYPEDKGGGAGVDDQAVRAALVLEDHMGSSVIMLGSYRLHRGGAHPGVDVAFLGGVDQYRDKMDPSTYGK